MERERELEREREIERERERYIEREGYRYTYVRVDYSRARGSAASGKNKCRSVAPCGRGEHGRFAWR